ncbi:hypothetical protein C8R45DRAFT_1211343 [Mycena sanguinolenta]|nr:hypothetical protein C8R45DRAFT_1211343 [Mycena sanguinolenta]
MSSLRTITPSSSHRSLRRKYIYNIPLKAAPLLDSASHQYHDSLVDLRQCGSESLPRVIEDVRHTHPCLRQFSKVYYHYGKNCWVVILNSATKDLQSIGPIPLYIGRRPVYISHGEMQLSHSMLLGDIADDINSDLVLTVKFRLEFIRKHFRYAYGVRVHRWGFIDVLFKTSHDLALQKKIPMPSSIGRLGFACILSEHFPTSHLPTSPSPPSCLGLHVVLEGRHYITTVSNAWISHDIVGAIPLKAALRSTVKRKLEIVLRPPLNQFSSRFSLPQQTPRQDKPLTPVGVTVYLEGTDIPMGQITKTYDDLPCETGLYLNLFPTTYKHDLALIEATDGHSLPKMTVPSWHATFSPQFARPETALRSETRSETTPTPAFILEHNRRRWRSGQIISEFSQEVLVCGADYIFEGEHGIKRALFWRTNSADHSMSGSVLCLGKPTYKQIALQALLFQNFETPLLKGFPRMGSYKGGFFLPEEVLNNAIIEVERESDLWLPSRIPDTANPHP